MGARARGVAVFGSQANGPGAIDVKSRPQDSSSPLLMRGQLTTIVVGFSNGKLIKALTTMWWAVETAWAIVSSYVHNAPKYHSGIRNPRFWQSGVRTHCTADGASIEISSR